MAKTKPQRQHWARHHRVLAAVLIVLIVVAVGLAIAQDQETLRIRTSVEISDPRFPQYLADLLGHRLTSSNSYVVYTNGDTALPAMLRAIDGAHERVSLETYNFEEGEIAERFTDALARAAQRGVNVRMVLDAIGSKKMSRKEIDRLEDAGCHVEWVNPVISYSIGEANYRTHRKALVVDGRVAFVGGMGIGDHYWKDTTSYPRWRDTQVELRGPAVTDVEAAFNQNWILTSDVVEPVVRPAEAVPSGTAQSIVVWSSRQTGANEMKLLFLLAIAAARHTIDIESPYLITDESSAWSLHEARRRGVHIRMLVDGDKTDAKAVKFAGRGQYENLLEDGIEIAEYQPTMMHAKAMMVDGLFSVVGSANFDNRSLELNDELSVAVFDRALTARLEGDFENDLTRSKKIDLESWRARPVLDRGRDWLWSYFGEVF
ncbi:MAG TPA: phospholipase D-like domain-containing protein [Vicinamibacterales bacterium]|jgi:cardiolipin synthase